MLADLDGLDGLPGTPDDSARIAANSPCIDRGDPAMTLSNPSTLAPVFGDGPPRYDLDGQARIWDGASDDANGAGRAPAARIDIGADEFDSRRFGDMNCDNRIDFDDIDGFVLALVGPQAYGPPIPIALPPWAMSRARARLTLAILTGSSCCWWAGNLARWLKANLARRPDTLDADESIDLRTQPGCCLKGSPMHAGVKKLPRRFRPIRLDHLSRAV